MCIAAQGAFTLTASLVAAVAALSGAVVTIRGQRRTAYELEQRKKELQQQLDSERHQHALQLESFKIALTRNNIQFSKLHEERVHTVIGIYDALFSLQGELHAYLLLVRHGATGNIVEQRTAAYNKMYDQLKRTWVEYKRRKFYFDKTMYDPIEAVFKPMYDIEQVVFGWQNTNVTQSDAGYDQNLRDNFRKDLDEAHGILRGPLQAALAALEDTMRVMLGVNV